MNAENIIEKLGRGVLHEAARKLEIPVTTIFNWKKNKSVPRWRHDHIRRVARENGVVL